MSNSVKTVFQSDTAGKRKDAESGKLTQKQEDRNPDLVPLKLLKRWLSNKKKRIEIEQRLAESLTKNFAH